MTLLAQTAKFKDHGIIRIGAGSFGHIRITFPRERAAIPKYPEARIHGMKGGRAYSCWRFPVQNPMLAHLMFLGTGPFLAYYSDANLVTF